MPFLPLQNTSGARLSLTEIESPRVSARDGWGSETSRRGLRLSKVPKRHYSAQAGAGMGMSLAFEFAGAVALFWFLGFLVDRWLGTEPIAQVVGGVLGWVGGVAHVYYSVQNRSGTTGRRGA